jgi:leucyl/phenylalanyl-tRNA--protein transferase
MAESKEGELFWHSPDPRAIIPLENIKIPKSMRQLFRRGDFTFTVDCAFREVVERCADRDETWINDEIIDSYCEFFKFGYAHSVEVWIDGKLSGGLYGVHIGKAFFGESMFSSVSNASKLCFYVLAEILKINEFRLLDSQYINDHTEMLGAIEISRDEYLKLLEYAVSGRHEFRSDTALNIFNRKRL